MKNLASLSINVSHSLGICCRRLREQNKKLAGHTNLKQRIRHVGQLKEEVSSNVESRTDGGATLTILVHAPQNAKLKNQLWKLKKKYGAEVEL